VCAALWAGGTCGEVRLSRGSARDSREFYSNIQSPHARQLIDQWRSQCVANGTTTLQDCRRLLLQIVQIRRAREGDRLVVSLCLLSTDTDLSLCGRLSLSCWLTHKRFCTITQQNPSMFLLFKLAFVRFQLLNVYDFNVLSSTRGMPLGLQIYSAICIITLLSDFLQFSTLLS